MALVGENGVLMKRKCILWGIIACFIIILLFPATTTHVMAGEGQVLTAGWKEVRYCQLSIEIKEVNSCLFCYQKEFSFVLDGRAFLEFKGTTYDETTDGLCVISQMFYWKEKNRMSPCSLIYPKDLSYFVLRWEEERYVFNSGTSLPFSELPIS